MTRSISLAPAAGDTFLRLPFQAEALNGMPTAAVSLLPAGDLVIGASDGGSARRRLLKLLGIAEKRVCSLHQVHSMLVFSADEIGYPDSAHIASEVEGDGLVCESGDAVLAVTVADCFPIFLADRRRGAFGIVHSGWRGTGIVIAALHRMAQEFGTFAEDVDAVVGPGIGPCCYNVPEERAELFRTSYGEECVSAERGRFFLDLGLVNTALLEAAGVHSVTRVANCTSCTPFLGSFRREGPGVYTHMLALIGHFG
jgi:purine-nucleoside/S-methyl-5'-thioadenosine phosphorylase / adenosine deaminase